MPNKELLLETLAYIKTHPEEWDQTHWRCGTQYCFAGTAVRLAGGVWYDIASLDAQDSYLKPKADDPSHDIRFIPKFYPVPFVVVFTRATRLLGLIYDEADNLFRPTNSLSQLEIKVQELINSHVEVDFSELLNTRIPELV